MTILTKNRFDNHCKILIGYMTAYTTVRPDLDDQLHHAYLHYMANRRVFHSFQKYEEVGMARFCATMCCLVHFHLTPHTHMRSPELAMLWCSVDLFCDQVGAIQTMLMIETYAEILEVLRENYGT